MDRGDHRLFWLGAKVQLATAVPFVVICGSLRDLLGEADADSRLLLI
jgi:hypothetical protein